MSAIEALRAAPYRPSSPFGRHEFCEWNSDVGDYIAAACNAAPELLAEVDRLTAERDALRADAERYRWLRAQHWDESPLAVVCAPKAAVKPGHDCPSLGRLDDAIDAALKERT